MDNTLPKKVGFRGKQFLIWFAALVLGTVLGLLGCDQVNQFCGFIAKVYTRLFQFIAVPTIALAIATTLASMGARRNTGRIFVHTIKYTLLTTFAAVVVGLILYKIIAPGNLPTELIQQGQEKLPEDLGKLSYYDHILSIIPDNIIEPFASAKVLSILLIAATVGLSLAFMKDSENIQILTKGLFGLQELFFTMIKALVWTLPLGIVGFAAQFSQMSAGDTLGQIGKYVFVVLAGNLLQFFVVLPLFLLARGVNPVKVFRGMIPAVLMALFTKSSVATLPVNIACVENNLHCKKQISRFILPICCTINMNGCAAFIFVTSLFVMQNGGMPLTAGTIALWMCIAVLSAIGNAGVPMGCYFLTLSLMSGVGVPIGIMGVILPVYALIDMIETAVNIYSDACICNIVNKSIGKDFE